MQDIHNLLSLHLRNQFKTKEFKIQDITQLKSGWAGDIFSFNVIVDEKIQNRLILKIYEGTQNGVSSIEKECKALASLRKVGYPVPELFSYDISLIEFDKPFLIMERIEGKLLWDVYMQDKEHQSQHMQQFTKLLFDLHSLDVKHIQPDFEVTAPITLIDRELDEISQIIRQYKIFEFEEIYQWLQDKKTFLSDLKPSIMHRDYHPWNVLVDETSNPYVIDWVWGIGDYRFDLAWTVTLMERSGFEQFAAEVYNQYLALMNSPMQDFEYFRVLATLRWILNVTVSIRSGENLREGDVENFRKFIKGIAENAIQMMQNITDIKLVFEI
ncbi:MAG: putative phosphotransferase enzyme family [Clostridiales bacterium]|nr:putative phosphotransferase enzyme family [Clostridiales bacterium]